MEAGFSCSVRREKRPPRRDTDGWPSFSVSFLLPVVMKIYKESRLTDRKRDGSPVGLMMDDHLPGPRLFLNMDKLQLWS